jgi:hypothetical protein
MMGFNKGLFFLLYSFQVLTDLKLEAQYLGLQCEKKKAILLR